MAKGKEVRKAKQVKAVATDEKVNGRKPAKYMSNVDKIAAQGATSPRR